MKKFLLLSLFLFIPFVWYSSNGIDIEFCNDLNQKNSLNLWFISPDSPNDVCINIKNVSNEKRKVVLDLVDWWINPSTPEFIGCGTNETGDKKDFAKKSYFTELWVGKWKIEFYLEWGEETKKYIKAIFLNWPRRFAYWCITSIIATPDWQSWFITVALRSAITLKAEINWTLNNLENDELKKVWESNFNTNDNERNKWEITQNNSSLFKADISNIWQLQNETETIENKEWFVNSIDPVFDENLNISDDIEIRNQWPKTIIVKKDFITIFVERFSKWIKNALASLFNI